VPTWCKGTKEVDSMAAWYNLDG